MAYSAEVQGWVSAPIHKGRRLAGFVWSRKAKPTGKEGRMCGTDVQVSDAAGAAACALRQVE
jgi:hypothetical protein